MNERELLFGVLTGEAKGELSKTGLSKFMQQNNEYKNLAFYDAVLEFAYKWEYWYEKLHQGEVVPYDSVLIFQSQRRRQQSHSKSSQQNSKNSTGMVSKEFFNDGEN